MTRISTGMAGLAKRQHALYRFFDRSDVLLYVGITVDIGVRFSSHRREKPWWSDVHHVTLEHFDSRDGALDAEAAAIRDEKPLHNVAHNEFVDAPAAPVHASIKEFAENILTQITLDNSEYDRYLQEARDYVLDEDETPMADTVEGCAALSAVTDAVGERYSVYHGIRQILKFLPSETVDRFRQIALDENHEVEPTEDEILLSALHHVPLYLAETYLDGLDPAEADEWMACAQTLWAGAPEAMYMPLKAAEYARHNKANGGHHRGLCAGKGKHGAMCSERALHCVALDPCRLCDDDCQGHEGFCNTHLRLALDGKFIGSTGKPLNVIRHFEIGPASSEAPF